MSVCRAIHQSDFVSPAVRDKHVETLAEAELAHYIVREIAEPIAHVLDVSLLVVRFEIPIISGQDCTQLAHMEEHNVLHSLECVFGESLAQHSSFATMHGFVDSVVRIVHALDRWESIVESRFLEPLAVSVNIVKSAIGVDRDEIRRDANMGTVFVVQLM